MQQLEGSIISRYRIQKQIASGGLSKSYTAVDRRTGQLVVMKLIHYSQNEHVERLQRTIQILSELKHEHILPILDHGQHDLWYYIVTPSSEDETLEQQFSKGPLSLEDAGHILLQLADALQFAHRHGIIYHNVQPCTILLKDKQHIYLTDASLSHDLQTDDTTAGAGLAPARGLAPVREPLAASTCALASLLYQMLTGGRTLSQLLNHAYTQNQQEVDVPPSSSKPALSLPESIEAIILRALAPDQRFQTPLEFAQAYQDALAQFIAPTSPVTIASRLKDLRIPLVRTLPIQNVSLIQRFVQKYQGERLLIAVIASAVILILTSLFIAGVSFFSMHQQVAQQNHQSGRSSQSRVSGTISPSPTISPTAHNTLPRKQHLTRARPTNGPTYATQPTVQPVMQPYSTAQPTVQPSPTAHPTVQPSPTIQITAPPYPAVQPTVQPTVQPPTPTPTPTPMAAPGNHGKGNGNGNGNGNGQGASSAQDNQS